MEERGRKNIFLLFRVFFNDYKGLRCLEDLED